MCITYIEGEFVEVTRVATALHKEGDSLMFEIDQLRQVPRALEMGISRNLNVILLNRGRCFYTENDIITLAVQALGRTDLGSNVVIFIKATTF